MGRGYKVAERAGSGVGPRLVLAYFVEVSANTYEPTVSASTATHGLVDVAGEWEITPTASLDGSVAMRRVGATTFVPYMT